LRFFFDGFFGDFGFSFSFGSGAFDVVFDVSVLFESVFAVECVVSFTVFHLYLFFLIINIGVFNLI